MLASVLLNFDFELRSESVNWSDQKAYIVWEKLPLNVNIKNRTVMSD